MSCAATGYLEIDALLQSDATAAAAAARLGLPRQYKILNSNENTIDLLHWFPLHLLLHLLLLSWLQYEIFSRTSTAGGGKCNRMAKCKQTYNKSFLNNLQYAKMAFLPACRLVRLPQLSRHPTKHIYIVYTPYSTRLSSAKIAHMSRFTRQQFDASF